MEEEFPHPKPLEEGRIVFRSKHESIKFRKNWENKKHFKKCIHLKICEYEATSWSPHHYTMNCDKNSLDEREFYRSPKLLYGCPKGCECYQKRWLSNIVKLGKNCLSKL